ncbi:hypothetical protein [Nonomuraea sp. NPDC046570]|uniref:hypothetical protein n=1 Tax=Nonomuraea sp. NPDC046570 TaxID=3155255 RepID=UPI00340CE33A
MFVAEGTSDLPLADIVEALFVDRGVTVRLSKPDFSLLDSVPRDVESRIAAGFRLVRGPVDVVVVHRDSDNAGYDARRGEIERAVLSAGLASSIIPIVPIRMTEAWLLLDEAAIRQVAGNPRGRENLKLPKVHEVEGVPDPKQLLRDCLLRAGEETGRRRERMVKRFCQHRRQLLERLDRAGPVSKLTGWKRMVDDIERICQEWA